MPNALSTIGQGSSCYIQVPTWSAASATEANGGWYLRRLFKAPATISVNLQIIGSSGSTAGSLRVLTDGTLRYRNNTADLIDSPPGAIVGGGVYDIMLRRVYTPVEGIELLINGSLVGFTTNVSLGWLTSVNQLDRFSSGTYSTGETREFETFNGFAGVTTYSDLWDGTTAPSTGTNWPSVGGTRNLTIANATGASNSWWVFYSEGGGDVELSANLSSTSSISASLRVRHTLSAALTSASTISASLRARHTLSASLTSVSSISASLTVASSKIFPIDVTGIPDGSYPVAIFNHTTGDFITRQTLAFAGGHAEYATTLALGTDFSGYVITSGASPANGAVIFGQVANAP